MILLRLEIYRRRFSDCEELEGEVNHTTECVTDLETNIRVEWTILWSSLIRGLEIVTRRCRTLSLNSVLYQKSLS